MNFDEKQLRVGGEGRGKCFGEVLSQRWRVGFFNIMPPFPYFYELIY